ncbi:hypothetical protein ANN_05911 [Periplaneta americana]|uniref:UDENN domain-containing protein n=1 Tax=Periplaneta americana TaxID=6978 RepID=A0ABQ8TEA3_PERAM|nr:hypothetical protein ANN_05911 [Periplaneta americana]
MNLPGSLKARPICNMVTTVVRRPLDSRLEERDLTQLFSALPVPALLQLFGSLLLERKVILISNSLSRLSSCVEALQSILYPFSWQHTLIPVLPTSLLDICLSPTPYIVGILRGRDANTVPGSIDESMMVDLDESRIVQGVGDEASILPSRLRRCLKVALQLVTNTTQPWDASRNVLVSEAFVRMFVEVCGHYRNHIVTQQDGLKVFERESFIKAVSSQSTRLFLEWFTETAMFSAFIESRLESESDIRGMFDQRCMEHSEEMENNTKLFLRNYKVLNKKVKTFGKKLRFLFLFFSYASAMSSAMIIGCKIDVHLRRPFERLDTILIGCSRSTLLPLTFILDAIGVNKLSAINIFHETVENLETNVYSTMCWNISELHAGSIFRQYSEAVFPLVTTQHG